MAMSRYKDSGYDKPSTNNTMTARLFVSSQSTGIVSKAGNAAARTRGIVSPMIIQNAIMPPNAKAHWAMEMATSPDFPKQYSMVDWKESRPLNFELVTMRRIVQSTVTVKAIRRTMPETRPACLKA